MVINYKIQSTGVNVKDGRASLKLMAIYKQKQIAYVNAVINSTEDCVELDIAVLEEFRGNGIAGELLDKVLNKVFVEEQLDDACKAYGNGTESQKVVLSINTQNLPSRRVAEKMGFSLTDADSHDSVQYAMTKQEYLNTQQNVFNK